MDVQQSGTESKGKKKGRMYCEAKKLKICKKLEITKKALKIKLKMKE